MKRGTFILSFFLLAFFQQLEAQVPGGFYASSVETDRYSEEEQVEKEEFEAEFTPLLKGGVDSAKPLLLILDSEEEGPVLMVKDLKKEEWELLYKLLKGRSDDEEEGAWDWSKRLARNSIPRL